MTSRRYLFSAFVVAVFALVAGLLIAGIATFVIGGGWHRAIEPWFDCGLWLVLIGAVATQVAGFTYVEVSKEPAAVKVVAFVAIVVSAFAWFVFVGLGVATVGFGGIVHDPLIIVSSMPIVAAFWLGVPTFTIVVVALLARRV